MSLAPDPSRSEMVMHAGRVRERIVPAPGEVWLKDGENMPVIVTSLSWGRVSFVQPQADDPGYRASYIGSDYFFADDWTRLWPSGGELPVSE